MSGGDFITVLRSAGPLLAKCWGADGTIEPYGNALQVRPIEHAVGDLAALHDLLQRLAGDPRSCVVRGRFVGTEAAAAALAGDPKADGLRDGYTLRRGSVFNDAPHHWIMLDVDGFMPATADPVLQPEAACLEFIRAKMPEAFWDVSFVWHLSGSAGHTKSAGKLKCHLWFWLSAARTSAELRAWARSVPGIDPAVFQAVQPHFVADPVMSDGVVDPVPRRLGFAQGLLDDVVHLQLDDAMLAAARAAEARERRPMTDPGDKPGLVGAFCRHYGPDDLAELLPGEFEVDDERPEHFSWTGHDNPGGVYVTACGHGLVSTHGTAPTGQNRRRNIADFTRMHLFGHLDDGLPDDTALSVRPSYAQWKGWVKSEHPGVWAEFVAEVREDGGSAEADFGDLDDGGEDAVPDAQAQPGAARPGAQKAAPGRRVTLISGDSIAPQPLRWLWPGWLARGKLHILAGAAGLGKTTITMGLAATVSRGGRWPDGSACEPGNVLVWSGEDDPADTLVPRLMASGADMSRVHFIGHTVHDGKRRPFSPAQDMAALAEAARELGDVRLLIVDPIVSAIGAGTDSHKNTEVRVALQPLVDLADRVGCALLGISHFSKGTAGRDPVERIAGSIAFGAVARVVLGAAKVRGEDGDTRRVLVRAKSNIGPDDGGFEYALQQADLPDGVTAQAVLWGKSIAGAARDILAEVEAGPQRDLDSGEAEAFIRQRLDGGAVSAREMQGDAEGMGLSWRTVQRVFRRLGGKPQKSGMRGGWLWSLPGAIKGEMPMPAD